MAQVFTTHARSEKPPLFSDKQVQDVANGGSNCVSSWVRRIANERNLSARQTPARRLARSISRLSDAETDLDPVEELLITLRRVHVITPYQRGLLLVHYRR